VTGRRTPRTVEEITLEIAARRGERRVFAREHSAPHSTDVHEMIDRRRADAGAYVETMLSAHVADLGRMSLVPSHVGDPLNDRDLHALAVLAADDGYWQRLHAVVDAAPAGTFAEVSKAAVEERLAEFDQELAGLEEEARQREKARRLAEVEAEFAGSS
jgi:hypothetical protein